MCKVIAVSNQKGGVGKTTTSVNLGIGLVREGYKVLLIDADPQGNLSVSLGTFNPDELETTIVNVLEKSMNQDEEEVFPYDFGILSHEEGISYLPSNIELSAFEVQLVGIMRREYILADYIERIKESYDYIIIDCMPSLGMITVNALVAADTVLIPVSSDYLSVKGLQQLMGTITMVRRKLNRKLRIEGILLTMVDSRTNFSKAVIEQVRSLYGDIGVFETMIPLTVKVKESSASGCSLYTTARTSKATDAYELLAREVISSGSVGGKR